MSGSRRKTREWRIILWIGLACAIASTYFGYAVRTDGASPTLSALTGVVNSLLIATPLSVFEIKGRRFGFLRRLRRLPLAIYFGIKVLLYLAIIIGGLRLTIEMFLPFLPKLAAVFPISVIFAIAMSIAGNLLFLMGDLIGYRTLGNLVSGRYVQPKREERAFLLIDMKDSTSLAERLGPIHFHELLNDFFRHVSDAALECDAEIHKYLGDEAILTWPDERASADNDCLACPFIARDIIAAHAETYRRRFGAVPTFRAALHRGEIVAGEIGDVRREIAYVGDTLNVAARLLEAAKSSGHDVLVSADLLERTTLPADLRKVPLPTLNVRGRAAPIEIAALEKISAAS